MEFLKARSLSTPTAFLFIDVIHCCLFVIATAAAAPQRQADAFDADELHAMLQKYNVTSPSVPGNILTRPFPFNLMFKTTIGPEGTNVGFLRPETAQGLFVNFR
jgi:glycyl-tRNA synthetase (class II)